MNEITHMDPAIRMLIDIKDRLIKRGTEESTLTKEILTTVRLTEERDRYCEEMTSGPSAPVLGISEMTSSHPWSQVQKDGKTIHNYKYDPIIMSGHLEGEFLKSFVSACRAQNVLEIGTFTGYSALAMAEALPENGKLITLEMEPYIAEIAQANFNQSTHGYKIQIVKGQAIESLRGLVGKGKNFDVIFMDANKQQYSAYYEIIMAGNLLAQSGTIIVDNALYRGGTYTDLNDENSRALRTFNKMVADDSRVHNVMLPIRDGILLIRRLCDVTGEINKDATDRSLKQHTLNSNSI